MISLLSALQTSPLSLGYLDPGSGSMMLQLLLAGLLSSSFFVKSWIRQIRARRLAEKTQRMNAGSLSSVSFRDPAGFVYSHEGELMRQVNQVYREHYDRLLSSGLYDELVRCRFARPHEELSTEAAEHELAYKVLRPERVEFISYPAEWSFQRYSRRGARGTRSRAPGDLARDDAQGLQRFQRTISQRSPGPDRHAFVRDRSRRGVGGLPAVLRAFPGAAGAHQPARPPAGSALALERRRGSDRPGRAALAVAIAAAVRPGSASAPAFFVPAPALRPNHGFAKAHAVNRSRQTGAWSRACSRRFGACAQASPRRMGVVLRRAFLYAGGVSSTRWRRSEAAFEQSGAATALGPGHQYRIFQQAGLRPGLAGGRVRV